MKMLILLGVTCVGSVLLPTSLAGTQTTDGPLSGALPAKLPAPNNVPLVTEIPSVVGVPSGTNAARPAVVDNLSQALTQSPPARPDKMLSPQVPTDVQALVKKFEQDREALLKQQEAAKKSLLERLRATAGEDRAKLLDELIEKHRAWLAEQKAIREELRERLKAMREEFKNRERDQLLDEVKGKVQVLRGRSGQD